MYQEHWGLTDSPFQRCMIAQRLLKSPPHDEALARLHFLVERNRRLALLTGPPGCGKTHVLALFGETMRRRGAQVVRLNLRGHDAHRFLWEVAVGLGANPRHHDSAFVLWRRVEDRLAANRYQQVLTLLLFDDAFRADRAVQEHIVRLASAEFSSEAAQTIVLAGLEQQIRLLRPELLELAELRIELEPWDQEQLAQYLNDELTRAGARQSVFSPDAVSKLLQLSGGLPRRVNQLAELSLLAGAGQGVERIDPEMLETVYEELSAAALADDRGG